MASTELSRPSADRTQQRGVALILVLFIVALCTILVLDLTYSTFLGAQQVSYSDRSLKAEYLLKSAVNLARTLIQNDNTPEDGPQDPWGMFQNGMEVPAELIGLAERNVKLSLEIRPEASKIPLRGLVPPGVSGVNVAWRDTLVRLFQELKFDSDQDPDDSGLDRFRDRVFDSKELVANLIDYMDADKDDYKADDFPQGVDSQVPEGYFPNNRISRVEELRKIPGFTANRLRALIPYVHTIGNNEVNVNTAPKIVLKSLHPLIDDAKVEQLITFRGSKEGPLSRQNFATKLSEIVGEDVFNAVISRVTPESGWFQVIAKVDYDTSVFFARSLISKSASAGSPPDIQTLELF